MAASVVTSLDMSGTSILPQAVAGIACAFPELRKLNLSHNKTIGDAGVVELLQAGPWLKLQQLNLTECAITHVGVNALAANVTCMMPVLTSLVLNMNRFRVNQLTKPLGPPVVCTAVTESLWERRNKRGHPYR